MPISPFFLLRQVLTIGLVPFALLAAHSTLAQEASDIEEVIVIGELSRAAVEEQIIEVEDDIFRQFNASNARNNTRELNIECRRETPTGTHFPQRICEPVFLTRARLQNNRDFAADIATRLTPEQLQALVAENYKEMNVAYARLIQEDVAFAEIVNILAALRARLAQLQ